MKKNETSQFEIDLKKKNPGLQFIINDKRTESSLSKVWSKVVLAIHTYNFITTFFFLGIKGFPSGPWLMAEIITELLIVNDFVLRLVFRLSCPSIWEEMWLLHDKGSRSNFHLFIRMIGSIPQSLILCLIFRSDLSKLSDFRFATLRIAKLLRLRQISQYFEHVDI